MTEIATATQSPVPFKMAHFVLRCTRYREVVDWHLKVFQARVVHENDFCFHHLTTNITAQPSVKIPVVITFARVGNCGGIDLYRIKYRTVSELPPCTISV